jgi:hypothetical protein
MKRKAQPKPETAPPVVLPAHIVVPHTVYPAIERAFTRVPCIVCGSETRSDLTERLCWVCRRLKISAWRDSEPMPAQE